MLTGHVGLFLVALVVKSHRRGQVDSESFVDTRAQMLEVFDLRTSHGHYLRCKGDVHCLQGIAPHVRGLDEKVEGVLSAR